jgi:hypothetical protein
MSSKVWYTLVDPNNRTYKKTALTSISVPLSSRVGNFKQLVYQNGDTLHQVSYD